jgi:hypothetical protein
LVPNHVLSKFRVALMQIAVMLQHHAWTSSSRHLPQQHQSHAFFDGSNPRYPHKFPLRPRSAPAAAAEASTADALATLESVCFVRRAHVGLNPQVLQLHVLHVDSVRISKYHTCFVGVWCMQLAFV